MTRPFRMAIVVSHPIQHFCPLYRETARDPRVELKVFFASSAGAAPYFDPAFGQTISWGDDTTDGFDHVFLEPDAATIDKAVTVADPRRRLDDFAPDVVQVYGYSDRLARRTLLWCARRRVPSVMITDSELVAPRSQLTRVAKRILLPLVFRLPAGFLSIGDENERYYRSYGVKAARLHRSPIPIDSPGLDEVLAARETVRASERAAWQVGGDDVVLLAVGKSISRKRHEDIIEAVGLLDGQLKDRAVVVLAGGGDTTTAMRSRADELGVRMLPLGFLPVPSLFRAYTAADIFVHPSEADPHPLAVAEAVYCGLPIVVSDRVGSWGPTDDVQPGINGVRHAVGDVAALSRLIAAWMVDTASRAAVADASTRIGRARTLSISSRTFVDGLLKAFGR